MRAQVFDMEVTLLWYLAWQISIPEHASVQDNRMTFGKIVHMTVS
jgi:hypothetical protein